jgi:DNA polymerase III sliding clamp (beta) subunit (PCNA family)
VASTDGAYMVFSQEFESESQIKQELLLSQKVIKSLTGVDELCIWFSTNMIALDCGHFRVINTRGEEKFANYRKIFPLDVESNLSAHKFSLIEALNKCSLVNDQFKAAKVELSANEIRFLASDDMVNINAPIEAGYTGTVEATSVNFEKLLKLLNQIECVDVQFAIQDSKRAIVITSGEIKGYKGLIMPLNFTK